ncbi:hypothetical protein N802_14295 [Knoellia sinensis KCTC 19936]|uniref:DUF3040 domain-containing protein n=1 Tax=Knoellia sinensis KCTC 19936 TaxID=1385520 RepID=A0A0A0J8W1_9MICO|nr:DUF3040 domain-containing protein [Knoellia sinensis]KGN33214.1 hypothetical protein N802_14295 [Knoellia sinensis KCTC 19936]
MPLSEHEQRMLEQLEQALAAEDPKFASSMEGSRRGGPTRLRWIVGVVGVLVGLGLVLVGIQTTLWVGVGGFAVMVAAVAYALTPPRRGGGGKLAVVRDDGTKGPTASGRKQKSGPGFMGKLDDRWDKRGRDGWN